MLLSSAAVMCGVLFIFVKMLFDTQKFFNGARISWKCRTKWERSGPKNRELVQKAQTQKRLTLIALESSECEKKRGSNHAKGIIIRIDSKFAWWFKLRKCAQSDSIFQITISATTGWRNSQLQRSFYAKCIFKRFHILNY